MMEFIINERENFSHNKTGLHCVIWLGLTTPQHGARIKVSNSNSKMLKNDNFTITIPDKKIIGECKLSKKDLSKILIFIDFNKQLLIDYNFKRISLKYFYDNLIKYNDINIT